MLVSSPKDVVTLITQNLGPFRFGTMLPSHCSMQYCILSFFSGGAELEVALNLRQEMVAIVS